MVDLNRKVEMDTARYVSIMRLNGPGEMNDNVERLENLFLFNYAVVDGTSYPHKTIYKTTYSHWSTLQKTK